MERIRAIISHLGKIKLLEKKVLLVEKRGDKVYLYKPECFGRFTHIHRIIPRGESNHRRYLK
jgi:hypothetical protein